MDTAQWPQEIVVKPIDEIVTNTCIKPPPAPPMTAVAGVSGCGAAVVGGAAVDRKAVKPLRDQALNCPRCNSTNTKFCYYNNYSLTQPRYFCKTCRRYWTEGGSLRNIPVGGGSRKNKRSSSSSASKKPLIVGTLPQPQAAITGLSGHHQNPRSTNAHEAQDLNLAFPHGFRNTQNSISEFLQVPNIKNPLVSSCSSSSSALELLTGISSTSCSTTAFLTLPSAVHDPSSIYSTAASGFGLNYPMQEFMRPSLGFSLDGGDGGGYGGDPHDSLHQEKGPNATATTGGRLLFPFEDLKLPVSSSSTNSGSGGGGGGGSGGDGDNRIAHHHHHHHHHHGSDDDHEKEQGEQSAGFWTGMLGGGLGGGGSSWQL